MLRDVLSAYKKQRLRYPRQFAFTLQTCIRTRVFPTTTTDTTTTATTATAAAITAATKTSTTTKP